MAYAPITFVDGVTPLNAAAFNHLEDGIEALDALPKIPTPLVEGNWLKVQGGALVWAPMAAGGGGTDWEGAWAAGTAYVKGDVVTYQGITYVAVNDSTGQTPPPATPASIPLVTALPGSPVDGQEIILVDSLTAPTYSWRLRYVAGKASNKWVFVGGSEAFSDIPTQETVANAAYADPATPGPSLTAPVAGEYLLAFGGYSSSSGNVGGRYMAPKFGAATALDADAAIGPDAGSQANNNTHMREIKRTVAAGTVIKMQYRHTTATIVVERRWFRLTPVAVGG